MRKIKREVVLLFLRLLDYRLSDKAKRRLGFIFGFIVVSMVLFFLYTNLMRSHYEGERVRREDKVARDTKELVTTYADESFAKEHLSLTTSQWRDKEGNFEYSLAKTYMTYLASVEDRATAERAYTAIPWVSKDVGEPLLHWSDVFPDDVTQIITLKSLSRTYNSSGADKWYGLFDVTTSNKVGSKVDSLIKVELVVKAGKVSYWKLEHGGLK